uniref:Uncharacterized protein n=1 Tax=Nelumbo nucifera TaxID=4432 RepID=A0A822YFF4_NELNU|nr:TPA_asm: hypothetical protein HUJ06_031203 [Nelumbo nucifera]DAD30238.1 TPA_asm: hypothetical protein HUJ06_031706 [Nelumbo nucifera]
MSNSLSYWVIGRYGRRWLSRSVTGGSFISDEIFVNKINSMNKGKVRAKMTRGNK